MTEITFLGKYESSEQCPLYSSLFDELTYDSSSLNLQSIESNNKESFSFQVVGCSVSPKNISCKDYTSQDQLTQGKPHFILVPKNMVSGMTGYSQHSISKNSEKIDAFELSNMPKPQSVRHTLGCSIDQSNRIGCKEITFEEFINDATIEIVLADKSSVKQWRAR
jgi:hypothetical protein